MTPSSANRCSTSVCGSTRPSTERPSTTPAARAPSNLAVPSITTSRPTNCGTSKCPLILPFRSYDVYEMMSHHARHVQPCCFFGAYLRLPTFAHSGYDHTAQDNHN